MMAYDLFIETSLMVSLGIIVYLVSLAVSRTPEPSEVNTLEVRKSTRRLGALLPLDEIDVRLRAIKDKILRRLKVVIMKFDNFLSKRLNNGEKKI
ncbi:MAG: hypothetical protein A3F99_02720 [Candidatus Colwellbacteria bacterium RIFCSPLOWO2_12_FULL_43_11]|uniref:Uncharacterized protein n=2 Tax=Candidatus Colwelliibacteriota TaxID=1817904 RepID=A0A1G1Z9I9_9BACT|nr:MAG: hypothetical protein A3F99_02720 [Candidatus Colwellbacteria bacterium RIFCSPLOWO2_12_FULL_43_11]